MGEIKGKGTNCCLWGNCWGVKGKGGVKVGGGLFSLELGLSFLYTFWPKIILEYSMSFYAILHDSYWLLLTLTDSKVWLRLKMWQKSPLWWFCVTQVLHSVTYQNVPPGSISFHGFPLLSIAFHSFSCVLSYLLSDTILIQSYLISDWLYFHK